MEKPIKRESASVLILISACCIVCTQLLALEVLKTSSAIKFIFNLPWSKSWVKYKDVLNDGFR